MDNKFEKENIMDANNNMQETQIKPSNENIHGWLSFFLFCIGLRGAFNFIYLLATFKIQDYSFNYILLGSNFLVALLMWGLSVYTLIAFWKRSTNAVFLGKNYAILCFIANLASLIIGDFEEYGIGNLSRILSASMWCVAWYIYFSKSAQVKRLIPVLYRKPFKCDNYIIAFILSIYSLGIGLGIITQQYFTDLHEKNIVSKLHLGKNDYTDGVIVFTAPEGFTCHKYENEGITSHILEKGDSIHITITGGYDTQNTNSNFEYYWNNWKDSEMNNHTNVILENSKYTIHDNYCHFRSIRYEADTPIVWSFALLFNEYSGKICVCSIWSFEGTSNNINEILNSIKLF